MTRELRSVLAAACLLWVGCASGMDNPTMQPTVNPPAPVTGNTPNMMAGAGAKPPTMVGGAAGVAAPGGAAGAVAMPPKVMGGDTGMAARPAAMAGMGGSMVMGAAGMAGSTPMMTGGGAGPGPAMTAKDPKIPAVNGECPPFKAGTTTMNFMGLQGAVFEVGAKGNGGGSLIFYWHGTGSFSGEYATGSFQGPQLADLKAKGGILVSPQSGTGTGGDCSGTGTFAMDDFKAADQIAACAVRDWNIDPHRIYSTGCSAGGLQAGCMALMRSSYMAAAVPNSGGVVFPIQPQDPSHIPNMMTIHGAPGSDVVIVDFSNTSATIDDAIKKAGGFAIDCNHGGGHCGLPSLPGDVVAAGWQFMQDHPFGVAPEPYKAALPASFPKYCKIW